MLDTASLREWLVELTERNVARQNLGGPPSVKLVPSEALNVPTIILPTDQPPIPASCIANTEDIVRFLKGRMSDSRGVKLRFDSVSIPLITLDFYVARLRQRFGCSEGCLVLAMIYIDRLLNMHPQIRLTNYNVFRILLVSLVIAAKFLDDVYYTNDYYALVGGIDSSELCYLETYLLHLISYNLFVTTSEFGDYAPDLNKQLKLQESLDTMAPGTEDSLSTDDEGF